MSIFDSSFVASSNLCKQNCFAVKVEKKVWVNFLSMLDAKTEKNTKKKNSKATSVAPNCAGEIGEITREELAAANIYSAMKLVD